MKVICDRGALMEAVNVVAGVVPSRTPTPALACLKLVARKVGGAGELTLSGTDGETSLHVAVSHVDVVEQGQVAIPADKLRQIVSAEDNEPTLTLEVEGDQCTIKGTNAFFKVFAYPAQDFPPLPDFAQAITGSGGDAAKSVFALTSGALQDLVQRTIFATARETSRYAINGVLLKRDGKKLEMVATDGRRLAMSRTQVPSSKGDGKGEARGENVQCIIPTKALNILSKISRDPEEVVRLAITDSRIFFAFDVPTPAGGKDPDKHNSPRAVLSSNLVEGSFPPYEDVIPKDSDKKITADRDELSSAVRKASVLTNEESRGVRLSFSKSSKKLRLTSRAPEMGESEINVGLTSFEGDNDIEISFNPTFITDVLRIAPEQEVIVELKASNKPGLIRSSTNDFVYVVMPVNLPG